MRAALLLPILLSITACDPNYAPPGSQIGSETSGCDVVSEDAIADPSQPAEGFSISADDASALALGAFSGPMQLTAGGSQDLALALSSADAWVVQRRQASENTDGMELAAYCPDLYVLSASLDLQSDALLDEQLDASLSVDTDGVLSLWATADFASLNGSASPSTFEVADMSEVHMHLYAEHDGAGWSGDISFQGESPPEGSGDDATVSATNDILGSFQVAL